MIEDTTHHCRQNILKVLVQALTTDSDAYTIAGEIRWNLIEQKITIMR
jgi:hypothetical protein